MESHPPDSIAVVMGTRPEIIKLAPIIQLLGSSARVIHTGQHYDRALSAAFFDEFGIHPPETSVGIGGKTRGSQIGMATTALDQHFNQTRPHLVVTQGDTNSTAAAALAANAVGIPLVHVEAGLRSFDRAMPEEHNRVITDHLADLCLAPTDVSRHNLVDERIPSDRIVVTGNTVVDALHHLLPDNKRRKNILNRHGVEKDGFILSTFHRPENVDDPATLETILAALDSLPMPVLLPIHPRTRTQIDRHALHVPGSSLRLIEPLGYIEFLGLLAETALAISDSGGVQEEVSVLKRPMVVVRRSTERPEVLGTFCTLVAPGERISEAAQSWLSGLPATLAQLAEIPSPYGDGRAAQRSVDAMLSMARAV